MILLLLAVLIVYAYITAALTFWGANERPFEIFVGSLLMAAWPVALPVAYLYGTVRMRILYVRYRGFRYGRKQLRDHRAGIDEMIDRNYGPEHGRKVQ